LQRGDPLQALKRVALRHYPPALALGGIAMALLGELTRAKGLLRSADRKIHQIDPETGAVLRTIESDRFAWVDGEVWRGTWQDEASDVRRIDPDAERARASGTAGRNRRLGT
jgi:hypothetical protein